LLQLLLNLLQLPLTLLQLPKDFAPVSANFAPPAANFAMNRVKIASPAASFFIFSCHFVTSWRKISGNFYKFNFRRRKDYFTCINFCASLALKLRQLE
jgi:hypothetical protein